MHPLGIVTLILLYSTPSGVKLLCCHESIGGGTTYATGVANSVDLRLPPKLRLRKRTVGRSA